MAVFWRNKGKGLMERFEETPIEQLQKITDEIAEELATESKDPDFKRINSTERPLIEVDGYTIRPAFFKDTAYACALGSNPHSGVWGHGETIEESIESFKIRFREQRREDKVIEAKAINKQ